MENLSTENACLISVIPARTIESLRRYVEERITTGGFLYSVLSNDLVGAISTADAENYAALREIVQYVYNNLPSICWGSREKINNWLENKNDNDK